MGLRAGTHLQVFAGSGALRGRHEFRADGIDDRREHDAFNQIALHRVERPTRNTEGEFGFGGRNLGRR